jgi:hypothetical protein
MPSAAIIYAASLLIFPIPAVALQDWSVSMGLRADFCAFDKFGKESWEARFVVIEPIRREYVAGHAGVTRIVPPSRREYIAERTGHDNNSVCVAFPEDFRKVGVNAAEAFSSPTYYPGVWSWGIYTNGILRDKGTFRSDRALLLGLTPSSERPPIASRERQR